jgi:hypothetical protein
MLVVVVSKYVSRSKIGELTMPCRHCSGDFLHTVFRERQSERPAEWWVLGVTGAAS